MNCRLGMETLRGVLIGAGFFADFQAEGWTRVRGAELTAVADPLPERADALARRYGIPRVYTDAERMLETERPDFVDVATRPATHPALTALSAGHGAHVICQKPMAPTWDECRAMVRHCATAGVRLFIHENWRWQPWYREIARLLEAGACGRVFHLGFRIRTGDGRGREPYGVQPYFREMERFLVYETVIHFLDTLRYLAGEIEEVSCRIARINPVIRGEDYALVQARLASGAHGVVDANRIAGPRVPDPAFGSLTVEGERAMLRMSPDGRLWRAEPDAEERPHPFAVPRIGYRGDSVRAVQQHIIDCLHSGQPAECEGEDYLWTMAAVFACYESAATGRAVRPAEER